MFARDHARRFRRLARGIRLAVVAATVVGMVGAPAMGSGEGQGEPPQATLRTISLPELPAGSARTAQAVGDGTAWVVRDPIPAGDAVLVGADWGGGTAIEVEVRARSVDAGWGPWTALTHDDDHAPDPGSDEAEHAVTTTSDPLWIGRSDLVQVRTRGDDAAAAALELDLVDVAGGDGLAWVPSQLRAAGRGAASAATEAPAILPRSAWGADESRIKNPPRESSRVRFAIVHHTAGSNNYTEDQADDVIRAVYAYHLGKGWEDIAYNFLVDRFGRVWEGRAGGIDRAVIGGHAAGFNGGSFGVSTMGNFSTIEPPQVMLDALDRLLAWKLDLHHVDPFGQTEEIAGGGSSNRFASGTRVTLPTIIGHRNTNNTSCPGDLLYDHIAGLNGDSAANTRIDALGHPKAYGGPTQEREQPVMGIRPRWDVTFSDTADWRLDITDADGQLVRATGGMAADDAAVAWDLRDGVGELVAAGRYLATLTAVSDTGDAIVPIVTDFDVVPAAERRSGPSRVHTSVALSSWAFKHDNQVVIASSEGFADALVAGPLAGSLDSPVLLVPRSGVPGEVVDEILRLDAETAYLIGGEAVLPAAIEDQLRAWAGITTIVRLSGANRFETSAAVAQEVFEREHPTEGLIALGDHLDQAKAFPDALAAAAFGATFEAPVLLVEQTGVPAATLAKLEQRPWADGLVIFGGAGAIPDEVVEQAAVAAASYGSADGDVVAPVGVTRLAGTDRFDTARLAAELTLQRWAQALAEDGPSPYADPTGWEVVMASGRNWPDALGAGAAAAERGALFLLTDDQTLDAAPATRQFLRDHAADVVHVVVSGGPAAVSDTMLEQLANEVGTQGPAAAPPEQWDDAPSSPDDGGAIDDLVPPLVTALEPAARHDQKRVSLFDRDRSAR